MAGGQRWAWRSLPGQPGNAADLSHKARVSLRRGHQDAAPGGGHQVQVLRADRTAGLPGGGLPRLLQGPLRAAHPADPEHRHRAVHLRAHRVPAGRPSAVTGRTAVLGENKTEKLDRDIFFLLMFRMLETETGEATKNVARGACWTFPFGFMFSGRFKLINVNS